MAASGRTSGLQRRHDLVERPLERFVHFLGLSILEGFQGYGYARSGVCPPIPFPAETARRSTRNTTRISR